MRRSGLTLTAAVAAVACTVLAGRLQAATVGPSEGLRAASGSLDIVGKAQVFVWRGRRYCWYDNGWQGPGFYRCGYARRQGLGWGGGAGWHGWQQGVRPRGGRQQRVSPEGAKRKSVVPLGSEQQRVKPQDVQPKSVTPQGGQQQRVSPQGAQPKSVAPQGGVPKGGQQGGGAKGDQNK